MRVLIVGCGYVGEVAARYWKERGDRVSALTRTSERAAWLSSKLIEPLVVDWYSEGHWPELPQFDCVLVCVSHAPVNGIPAAETHVRGLENLVKRLTVIPKRFLYISTTGVYAHCDDGRWVDEASAVNPVRPGAIAAIAAEQWLAEHLPESSLVQLRAAGIYGPGRVPRLDRLRAGEAIDADPDSYLNLIHVEDLAGVILAMASSPNAKGVFNVSDGKPVLRRDYYTFIAKRIGAAAPRFAFRNRLQATADIETMRSRGEGNKRIANGRLSDQIGYRFRFPDYSVGLTPLLTDVIRDDIRKLPSSDLPPLKT